MAGVFSHTTKTMLKNIIRHTNSHNKVVEEDEMWQQRGRQKVMGSLHPSNPSYGHDDRCDTRVRRGGRDKYWDVNSSGRNGYNSWSSGPRHHRAHMDDAEEERGGKASGQSSTYWMRQLQKLEESDPNRWDHGGYKEMYPKDFDSTDLGTPSPERSKWKKKSSTKKKKRHHSKSTKHKSKSRKSSRRRRKYSSSTDDTDLSSDNDSEDETSKRRSRKCRLDRQRSKRSPSRGSSTSESASSDDTSFRRGRRSKKHHRNRDKSGRRDSSPETNSSSDSDLSSSDESGGKRRRKYRHKKPSAEHSKDGKKALKDKRKRKKRRTSKEKPNVVNSVHVCKMEDVCKKDYGHGSNGKYKSLEKNVSPGSCKRKCLSEDTSDRVKLKRTGSSDRGSPQET